MGVGVNGLVTLFSKDAVFLTCWVVGGVELRTVTGFWLELGGVTGTFVMGE
jgi:hypothetical protein